jgi:hypothetical protein
MSSNGGIQTDQLDLSNHGVGKDLLGSLTGVGEADEAGRSGVSWGGGVGEGEQEPPAWGRTRRAQECSVWKSRPDGLRCLGRVRLTVGNRSVYRGNRPYRPGPVTVPAGYQPLGLGIFEFEFQKLKIVGKIPKKTS